MSSATRGTVPDSTTDGVVTLRRAGPADVPALLAGRDAVSQRFLGPGDPEPRPSDVVLAGEAIGGGPVARPAVDVVGWVDHDVDRTWLAPGEVNLGYAIAPDHRGRGLATRAVQLHLHRLALEGRHRVATLLIDRANGASLALAERAGFTRRPDLDGHPSLERPVPPLTYTDGTATLRPLRSEDLDVHLDTIDEEQIRWLWLPGQREQWEAMEPRAQQSQIGSWLSSVARSFGAGPSWTFAVDLPDAPYAAFLECDLAGDHVPAGEANVSYSTHPGHRRRGLAARSVHLALRFLAEHTGARAAHLVVDAENRASLGVARAAGADEVERWQTVRGRTMVRHVLTVPR